jgi:GxxExxY protein
MNRDDLTEHEFESIQKGRTLDEIGKDIVDAAYQVHTTMGPGLNEAVYEECMRREFNRRKIPVNCQEQITIEYKGEKLDTYYIADMVVEGRVIVELKAVSEILPIHEAQLLNYLKLTNTRLGFLINFNVELIKNGIRRRKNGYDQ